MACFLLIVPLKALAKCQRSYWCITGVNDTGNACIAGVIDTGEVGDLYCPVSMTPVMHDVTGAPVHASPVSLTPANTCFAGVIDTGECTHCRCQWHRWVIFCRCHWHRWSSLKGTVRWDARWVENGLKRCILTNYMTASLPFLFLKRHHHEKSIKPVSAS